MTSLTLDTNCMIDIAEGRPSAQHVLALLKLGAAGRADLAMCASSASERQSSGDYLTDRDEFDRRRAALGFGTLPLLPVIGRFDIGFFGTSLWSWAAGKAREDAIYRTLFPSSHPEWIDDAAAAGVNPANTASARYRRWRNQLLDAQALWAHEHAGRDIFVTSDDRLFRLNGHEDFPEMQVLTPEQAAARFLRNISDTAYQ